MPAEATTLQESPTMPAPSPLRLSLILGSARHPRFGDRVAAWVQRECHRLGFDELDLIDPAELPLSIHYQPLPHDEWHAFERRLDAADGFIVMTPEYNHGYTAALKQLIDTVHGPWQAKPVGFVSYGGISGGLRAVEQLRLVFAELHAVTLRDTVSFSHARDRFLEDGTLVDPEREARRLQTLLARWRWWAHALRQARRLQPYGTIPPI